MRSRHAPIDSPNAHRAVHARTARRRYHRRVADTDDLNWDDLRFFLAAARHKTLAGAARAMRVEHTTIGRRLSALEKTIGGAVVLRGPDGLTLTALGERLVPPVEEVERAVLAARDAALGKKTRVRLAVPTGFTRLFSTAIARFAKAHPEIELEILSGSRPVDLTRGEADVAVRSGPLAGDDLVARRLCDGGFAAYASRAYRERHPGPIDPDDLTGHELVAFDTTFAAMPAAKWIEERANKATIVLRSREVVEMCSAAVSGVGIAVLPCLFGDAEPSLERIAPDLVATRELSLVYRREARLSANVQAVIRFATEVVLENATLIAGRAPSRRR